MSRVKVLWVGRETGTWASLHHWKKGYVAPRHKHLAGAHAYVLVGQIAGARRRFERPATTSMNHRASCTTKPPRSKTRPICLFAMAQVLFFDESGFTRYTNWEVMEKLRAQAAAPVMPRAEAAE